MEGYLLFFILIGLLLVGLSIPMIRRRVKPNAWYGFRTPRTTENPEIWYPTNAYAGKGLLIVGILIILAALLPLWLPEISLDAYAIVVTGVMLIGVTLVFLLGWRYSRRLP